MGRLDDIIVRNQHRNRFGERFTVAIGVTVFLLIILGAPDRRAPAGLHRIRLAAQEHRTHK